VQLIVTHIVRPYSQHTTPHLTKKDSPAGGSRHVTQQSYPNPEIYETEEPDLTQQLPSSIDGRINA